MLAAKIEPGPLTLQREEHLHNAHLQVLMGGEQQLSLQKYVQGVNLYLAGEKMQLTTEEEVKKFAAQCKHVLSIEDGKCFL